MRDDAGNGANEVFRKATRWGKRDMARNLRKGFRKFLQKCGITEEEWNQFCQQSPQVAVAWRREMERKFMAGLVLVYDAMFQKAISGDTSAMKLYLQKFDAEFVERKETKHDFGDEPPIIEDFNRILGIVIGPDTLALAQREAKRKGMPGVMGEELLPGGRYDGMDSKEVLEIPAPSKEKTEKADGVGEMFGFEE